MDRILINWQFRGSNAPPTAPYPKCGTTAASSAATCPANSACGAR